MADFPAVRFLDRSTPPHVATLVMLSGIAAMAMNVFLPSLPTMTAYFQTDYRVMQLSVALYLAVNAVLQVLIGPVSDLAGRRPVIMWSLGLFMVATVGCIYAPNATVFLIFRMAQSVIVGAMVLSRAVVRDIYPPDKSASMIGYVTMGMAVVPMISPALGGWLDANFGWQSSFWLLLLCAAAVMAIAWRDLGETSPPSGLTLGRQFREYPELLASRRFWAYALATAFSSGAFFAYLGGAPFVGTTVFGLSPERLGLYFGAPAIGYFAGNYISGRYSVHYGISAMMLTGSLIVAGGMLASLMIFLTVGGTAELFFGFMTLVGLGNGMVIPNGTAAMLSVRPHLAGTASGLGGAIMIGGGAALSALAGALLHPGTGPYPLLWIMAATSIGSVLAVIYAQRRSASLA